MVLDVIGILRGKDCGGSIAVRTGTDLALVLSERFPSCRLLLTAKVICCGATRTLLIPDVGGSKLTPRGTDFWA